jgi:hypothetical protein
MVKESLKIPGRGKVEISITPSSKMEFPRALAAYSQHNQKLKCIPRSVQNISFQLNLIHILQPPCTTHKHLNICRFYCSHTSTLDVTDKFVLHDLYNNSNYKMSVKCHVTVQIIPFRVNRSTR